PGSLNFFGSPDYHFSSVVVPLKFIDADIIVELNGVVSFCVIRFPLCFYTQRSVPSFDWAFSNSFRGVVLHFGHNVYACRPSRTCTLTIYPTSEVYGTIIAPYPNATY